MRHKSMILGSVIIFGIALVIFAIIKFPKAALDADDDDAPAPENVPAVVSVQVGTLQRMTLHSYINAYGTIEAAPATTNEPAAEAQLAAPMAGVVAKINVIAGQPVEKGDLLVELNSGAETFDYAQGEVERQKKLFAQQNTSLKNLQAAEAQLAALEIVAPISGSVTRMNVKTGEAVDPATIVAEVMNLHRLAVSAQIPADEANPLKIGDEVEISGRNFQLVDEKDSPSPMTALSFISPVVDANDGTVLVRALLPEKSELRAGQFLQLKIVTAVHTNCLAAPEKSVVSDENGKNVISLVKGDEAQQMPVEIGLRENGWVEIVGSSLSANDSVVTVGAYGLPDKTKIRVTSSADAQ